MDTLVISLLDHADNNLPIFDYANVIYTLELDAVLQEEDNFLYCDVVIFLKLNNRFQTIKANGDWILRTYIFRYLQKCFEVRETFGDLKSITVRLIAKQSVYSTWCQFHQSLN